MPLPKGSKNSDNGLLCVNNEYVSAHVMFENLKEDGMGAAMTKEQVALCNMAIGHSIIEIKREGRRLENRGRQRPEPAHHAGKRIFHLRPLRRTRPAENLL